MNPLERLESIFNFTKSNIWNMGAFVIMVLMAIVIGRNLIHAISINLQTADLNKLKAEYQESITRDSTILERMKYDEELERYARENYFMQSPDEEIFILE